MSDHLTFIPLGGSDEIGMNLNVYGYEDQWVIVDAGLMFIDRPGADIAIPDTEFLEDHAEDIQAIVLTHGHEDHIGGIVQVWSKLKCPIYATPFTASLIERKFQEHGIKQAKIHRIPLSGQFAVGDFEFQFVNLTHSILEPNGLLIRTPVGLIFHTGDWKIDPQPLIGPVSDQETLMKMAGSGVLAIVCDSTNALEPGHSGSEAEVRDALQKAVAVAKNRVFVSCFASNVVRLDSAIKAAQSAGRAVALMGRSLDRMYECARENGYLSETMPLIDLEAAMDLPRQDVLIICTGSQGEPRAALTRAAFDQHPMAWIDEGDTVILSSRVIPGNEQSIGAIHNELIRRGVHVITHREGDYHVSGHPCQDELKMMYEWVRPRIAIPVHGEKRHQKAHADLARSWGVPAVLVPSNGDVLEIYRDGRVKKVDEFACVAQAIDGTQLVPTNDPVYKQRNKMSQNGVLFASIVISLGKKASFTIDSLDIEMVGIVDPQGRLEHDIETSLVTLAQSNTNDRGIASLKDKLEQQIRNIVFRVNGKKPMVILQVHGI